MRAMLSRLSTWALWITLLIAQLFVAGQCSIGCLDNHGKPVDWFIVIKLPHLPDSSESTVQQGVGQLYMDVNNEEWTLLDKGIDENGGHAVYNTLQQIYSNQDSQEVMYMLYNDEIPDGETSMTYGHTKGDVCFDKSSGFWLVHSVPKFPPRAEQGYNYPKTGHRFGQSLLCVTFSSQQLNEIGLQLLYNYPQIYDSNLPTSFKSDNPNVADVINGKHVEGEPWSNVIPLPSQAGQNFVSFAKYTSYDADLYDSLVAPYFKAGLNVETWLNKEPMPSSCSARYKVIKVTELKFLQYSYKVHNDHSKWAASLDNKWICIGDINREEHQKVRAGGTLCGQLRSVSKVFNEGIISTEQCTSHENERDRNDL